METPRFCWFVQGGGNWDGNAVGMIIFLTHDCPPGAIQVEAFLENDNTNPFVIVPEKFEAVRESVH